MQVSLLQLDESLEDVVRGLGGLWVNGHRPLLQYVGAMGAVLVLGDLHQPRQQNLGSHIRWHIDLWIGMRERNPGWIV